MRNELDAHDARWICRRKGSPTAPPRNRRCLTSFSEGCNRARADPRPLSQVSKLAFGENIANNQPPHTVSIEGRSIQLYPVHWADLLNRERVAAIRDSFNIEELFPLPWFLWLHLKDSLYPANSYSRRSVFWRWLLLIPAIGGLLGAWAAASLLQGLILIVCGLLRIHSRDYLGLVLDGYLGDVFNYIKSAGRVRTQNSPLYDVAGRIQAKFHDQLTQACKECSEVQILAHSLGTLVTYHGITGYNLHLDKPATSASPHTVQPLSLLTRIYTIGCPLEKIRFFWPKLITEDLKGLVDAASTVKCGSGGQPTCRFKWDNFYNPLDVVAGKLKTFDHWVNVSNHTLWQGGLATAHIRYEENPAFLSVIGKGLGGKAMHAPPLPVARRVWHFLKCCIETTVLPAILFVLIILGWAFFLGIFWGISALLKFLIAFPDWIQIGIFLFLTFLFLVGIVLAPSKTAKKEHKAHWGKDAQ